MLSFQDFCGGFCAIHGLSTPSLDTGREGLQAFTLDVGEVQLSVLNDAQIDPSTVFLVAELEPPPFGAETDCWLSLLEANYWLHAETSPIFSRNPDTDAAILQWSLHCTPDSVRSLHQWAATIAHTARRWHQPSHSSRHEPPPASAMAAFA